MKIIKRKTYNNFLYVVRKIQEKGYSMEEAENLAHKVFAQITDTLSAQRLIDMILTKDDYEKEYHIL